MQSHELLKLMMSVLLAVMRAWSRRAPLRSCSSAQRIRLADRSWIRLADLNPPPSSRQRIRLADRWWIRVADLRWIRVADLRWIRLADRRPIS